MSTHQQIDRLLGSDPQFGSAEAIEARNVARYRLGLTVLARHFPEAAGRFERLGGVTDAELRPFLYDPVLRNAFENDLVALENHRQAPSEFARQLAGVDPEAADGLGPTERLMDRRCRPWPGRGVGWVWTELRPEVAELPLAARLEELKQGSFTDLRGARRVTPDEAQLAGLARGAELLAALLPSAGAGVFPHISLVGLAQGAADDGELHSFSGGDPLPSALFVAPEHLGDPWMTAEILLHEGLHLKQFDMLRTGALVADPGHQVEIPWRLTPWTLTRVLAALHVYSHLVLFFAAAAAAPPSCASASAHRRSPRASGCRPRAAGPPSRAGSAPAPSGPATSGGRRWRCTARRSPRPGGDSSGGCWRRWRRSRPVSGRLPNLLLLLPPRCPSSTRAATARPSRWRSARCPSSTNCWPTHRSRRGSTGSTSTPG
ncbi:HEXXH motif-containing putative peptide modification protein [Kitasatospora gansuensis]